MKVTQLTMNLCFSNTNRTFQDHVNEVELLKKNVFFINVTMMFIGLIDNIVSFTVFLQKKMLKRKVNYYWIVLTIFELMFCATIFIDFMFYFFHSTFLHDLNKISRIVIDFITHTSDSCIVLLTLFISINRLYSVKYPLKCDEYFINCHAKLTITMSISSLILLKILNSYFCEKNGINIFANILYCTFLSTLIFNIIPLVIILIVNSLLVFEVICYYKKKSKTIHKTLMKFTTKEGSLLIRIFINLRYRRKTSSSLIRIENYNIEIRKLKKSYCIVIMLASAWSLVTSIPYYSFKSLFLLNEIDFLKNLFCSKNFFKFEIASTILFDSCHCINFFIFMGFDIEFREVLSKFYLKKIKCT